MTHNFALANVKVVTEQKELDDLVRALGENKLPLHRPCMEGTRTTILQEIENEIKSVDGHNLIWIRGSPGVGKSALAASVTTRLREQGRHFISFRFDRTQSASITTDALWCVVTLGLARLYPSVRQHILNIVQKNRVPELHDIDGRFKFLIETPLLSLNDVSREDLPVIVIDALDECGGLRYDLPGKDDYKGLLHTLKHWAHVDHLKRFKLVIASRQEDHIIQTFPKLISIHITVPSGSDVQLGDAASEDIRIFLKSSLKSMGMKDTLIKKALDYLVPRAAGIFIWATTVANFLELDPEGRFATLEKGLKSLYSLYEKIIKASFGHELDEEEIGAVTSVMGAMIFAKQALDDDALIMLPQVRIPYSDANRLGLIRKGLASVIESGSILRFHHRSLEDFLLSTFFLQQLPEFSTVQDRGYHEHQLAVLCLKTLVSPSLHFNMCNLESSIIKNVDIQPTFKSTIPSLVLYSCLFWVDHIIQTPFEEKMIEAVEFVMYEKLLFWLEVMSLTGNVHEAYMILRKAATWKVCFQIISLQYI